MKAAINIAVIAAVSTVVVIGVISFNFAYQVQSISKGVNERNIIESMNQINSIKNTFSIAALFSIYHGIYDVLKTGSYVENYEGNCDSDQLVDFPTDLPYWRVYDEICIENQIDLIQLKLQQKLPLLFFEYVKSMRDLYPQLEVPEFSVPFLTINKNKIFAVFTSDVTNNKIKFQNTNLEISTDASIEKTVSVIVNSLIDNAKEIFLGTDDPIDDKIVLSASQMRMVDVKTKLNNDNLSGNCEMIRYDGCYSPNSKFTYPTKREMFPETCKTEFISKLTNNIETINFVDSLVELSTDVTLSNIKTNIEFENEDTCLVQSSISSLECGCIEQKCIGSHPVKLGDSQRTVELNGRIANQNDICVPCTSIITGSGSTELCEQYTDKLCLEGSEENGRCVVKASPICPSTGSSCSSAVYDTLTNSCYYDQGCPREIGCPSSNVYEIDSSHNCEIENGNVNIYKASPNCPNGYDFDIGNDVCVKYEDKQCPSGTEEFQNTGRCYSSLKSVPECTLRENLYTKQCQYEYKADVATLVNVKSNEKYPIYDYIENQDDLKNLQLKFYILSKN